MLKIEKKDFSVVGTTPHPQGADANTVCDFDPQKAPCAELRLAVMVKDDVIFFFAKEVKHLSYRNKIHFTFKSTEGYTSHLQRK